MQLSPVQAVFLTPSKASVIFATKGVIAMALSLLVAMYLNLDRPYWALISAVFLQLRPQSGLVIEKSLCQIFGTLIGGAVGIAILEAFVSYPELAIGALALWLGINATASAMMRSTNFIYAFAMAGITACIIVLLVMVNPATASSQTIFAVAQARISEIVVGSICAALVSQLLWPVSVAQILQQQARTVVNQTLDYLAAELAKDSSHEQRHQHIDTILASLTALTDDATAVTYEGPLGPGRSRAANLLCNKVMSLLAVIQIFGRLQRNHPEQIPPSLNKMLASLSSDFSRMSASQDFDECYQLAKAQRGQFLQQRNDSHCETPLERRLLRVASELISDLMLVMKAYDALQNSSTVRLNAPALVPHRDPLVGLTTGLRTTLMFLIGAGIWIGTGSASALMIMLLPVIFSIMLARLPMVILMVVLKRLLIGIAISTPLAIFFALNLLAQSSGDFELLVLILAGPFFVGLIALSNQPTLPYGLGICIPFVILVQPGNDMSRAFSIDYTVSNAFAIAVGVTILICLFRMITGPSAAMMQAFLIKSAVKDLRQLHKHHNPEDWFNARMGERLLRLTNADKGSPAAGHRLTDLGLTGLNLGHISARLQRSLRSVDDDITPLLNDWQNALADAYLAASRGETSSHFTNASNALVLALQQTEISQQQRQVIEGMCERIAMTFERTAEGFRSH
ncbi:FUSC family protein [Shewanella sp. C32]|uniref:FUSC family protein n=1 Tax=Shewanella electrica TaxID=515560 RepID=A0ABT2FLT8_9GAMM|nr:FUSC family protein [Shewanella electrica]MCH1924301.1 FUSC family protein [Shewanella electrica]MCS4556204.1 FUSC family protein [Shewanella electrica]